MVIVEMFKGNAVSEQRVGGIFEKNFAAINRFCATLARGEYPIC